MVVTAGSAVACDVETVAQRDPGEWAGLLGDDGLALAKRVAAEHDESLAVAATRVWGALETLRKTGRNDSGLTLEPARAPRWVVLRAGATAIATFVTALRDVSQPVVFTIQAQEDG
jgi:enediyne polyketide synthase